MTWMIRSDGGIFGPEKAGIYPFTKFFQYSMLGSQLHWRSSRHRTMQILQHALEDSLHACVDDSCPEGRSAD